MFSRKGFGTSEFILFAILACMLWASQAQATWSLGDDVPAEGFSWSLVPDDNSAWFYYVDSDDGKVKRYWLKCVHVWTGHYTAHGHTTTGTPINHQHWEREVDDYSETNGYYDARFLYCTNMGGTSNRFNCACYAFTMALSGLYTYWAICASDGSPILTDDATPEEYVEPYDVLWYPSQGHATYVEATQGGLPYIKYWKYRESAIYRYAYGGYDTPMMVGDVTLNCEISGQLWTWSESGAGANSNVYRAK